MPSFCLIVGCSNDKNKRPDFSFCRVPKIITSQGDLTGILTTERRARWLAATSRDDLTERILEDDRVCGIHFHSGKHLPFGINLIQIGFQACIWDITS